MSEEYQTLYARNLYFPKCPYNNSVFQWVLRLGLLVLGTVGLTFLNLWVAVAYLTYFVVLDNVVVSVNIRDLNSDEKMVVEKILGSMKKKLEF